MTVSALRAIQRYGATEMLDQAFTGFAALPPAGRVEPWWEVLGVQPNAAPEVVRAAFREWFDVHPDAHAVFNGFEGVYGLAVSTNEDAFELERVLLRAEPDCSGAMFHAVVNALAFIRKNGWTSYCSAMRHAEAQRLSQEARRG